MKKLYLLLFTILITSVSFAQMTTVFQESFETGNSGTASETCNDNFYDFFTRTDGSDVASSYVVTGMDGTFYFAAQDTDGSPCTLPVQTLTFTGINISTYSNLTFAILAAEDDANDGKEDWDADTNVLVEVNIDGAGYIKILQFSGGGATNTAPGLDTNFDGTADGTLLSSTFQEFTATVGTGSSADIRITFTNLNAGDEDIALDNIRLIDNFAVSPSILVSSGTLSDLKYFVGTGPSAEKSFTVEGSNLTADINVTAPTNFEVSTTSGSGFGASVSLRQTTGTVASTTIYVRLKAGLALNSNYIGDITISSTGASNKTVSLTGGVFVALTNAMVLTGVFDPTAATPRGVEVFVIKDIPDLSIFGVEGVNNGGGANGQEFTFPAVSATAGDYIYLVAPGQEAAFATFFGTGFSTGNASSAMFINGNDAIVLYENTFAIDIYGETNVDGVGQPWEYTDGWAYRIANAGPTTTFATSEWTINMGGLDGATNSASTSAFPAKTYQNTLAISQQQLLDGFAMYPNPVKGGLLNIQSASNTEKNIRIYDMIGKQVFQRNTSANQINISTLKGGIYFVKVQQDGKVATRKLVVE